MTDPRQILTTEQVREAGIDDWRQLLTQIKARFRTRTFAKGLALVDRIGAAAEQADHHPDITLVFTDVIVTLTSHDVRGVTSRDIDLARQISDIAADLDIRSDTSGLTQVELGLDTAAGETLAPFYAALLNSTVIDGEPVDPSGQAPTVWWQPPGASHEPSALPDQATEQRWHLDVWVAEDEAQQRLEAALAAGGRLVSDASAPSFWVLEDADGNRSCICTAAGR